MKEFPYQKILIVGCGGAGKSTLARAMGERFSLPVVHLDRLWWLPGWVERGREEFDQLLSRELEKPQWIMDGNYARTFSLRLTHCEAVIFLDLPTEECIGSIYDRAEQYRGVTRPDMTEGCPERVDGEFRQWVESFQTDVRDDMLRHIHISGKASFIFRMREEAYAWMNGFCKAAKNV